MHILVAEDDVEYRNILQEALELYGHKVSTVADGAEAYKFLMENAVGLVVSDINMPNCTGAQLHELIRSHEQLRRIPFVYITGFAILRVATPLDHTGLDFMVSKVPFDRLIHVIRELGLGTPTVSKAALGACQG